MYQKYIGNQNLELQLNKLADDPRIQASIARMIKDRNSGRRDIEPMQAYFHNVKIKQLFNNARRVAWAKMRQDLDVQNLMDEQRRRKMAYQKSLNETSSLLQMNK